MSKKPHWTQQEIQILSDEYLKGTRIVDLAIMLNRTTSALNKALFRFKIRKHFPRNKSLFHLPGLSAQVLGKKSKPKNQRVKIYEKKLTKKQLCDKQVYDICKHTQKERMVSEKKSETYQQMKKIFDEAHKFKVRKWVRMECVLNYLREKQYIVFKLKSKTESNESLYYVNRKPYNQIQLIQFANADREQSGLPPYYVRGVTWE